MPAIINKRDPVATRQRILACAGQLLVEGEGALEMAWVAKAAGVSAGLAYHHFGSKEGLLVAVVNDFYDRVEAASLMARLDGATDWEARERERLRLYIDFLLSDPLGVVVLSRLAHAPGVAAVEALEALGFEVVLPRSTRCCGRPLYDYGMLTLARRWLEGIVDDLRDEIRSGTPVVVLEPSCLAVFRDELTELLPHDHDARRLAAQTYGLAELVGRHVDLDDLAAGSGPDVLYHPHCHQQAVVGTDADHALLAALGCEVTDSEAGCCGLAGSFGFEAEKYDVSVAIGERKLAPMVRDLGTDAVVVADGFSCRTQVADLTGRRPRHVAELLRDRVAPSRREEHDA